LDKIGSILKLISESKPEDVNSWRLHGSEAVEKPELKVSRRTEEGDLSFFSSS
jgi:hypothetical protein